jgi:hypothetical protein
MIAYVKISTLEYPRHEGDIRLEHPEIGATFTCPDTYALVAKVEKPSFDPKTQLLYQGDPVFSGGEWRQNWIVRDKTPEEIEAGQRPRRKIDGINRGGIPVTFEP